jgi:uncharacterized protein YbgA (DUF1722 family)/uncharacterized protein YbbK (DUF523 family)
MAATASPDITFPRLRIGVSSCLLGNAVRYDGNHKRQPWLVEQLGRFADFVPYCPEMAIGLGVPREPIQLYGDPDNPRVRGVVDQSIDVTDALYAYGEEVAGQLGDIDGYVFMSKSPSCGVWRVKVRLDNGQAPKKGRGAYAAAVIQQCPHLPVEEEGRLNDHALRENFVTRLYVWQRWLALLSQGLTAARLIDFHTRHKYLVMAHSQAAYRRMGQLLSHLKGVDLKQVAEEYIEELMSALQRRAGAARHVNVLQHIMGYLKRRVTPGDKQELLDSMEAYRRGDVPMIVPVTLLRHHFRHHPDEYISMQWYLWPYPDGLGLRSHT